MKKQYFKSLPKLKEIKLAAYQSQCDLISAKFDSIQQHYSRDKCIELLNLIQETKQIKELKKADREPIFDFFLQRQLATFNSIKNGYSTDFKIMKATKCRKEGLVIDWRELWERLLKECPEVAANSSSVEHLIRAVKIFFDPNNALDVWHYFKNKHPQFGNRIYALFIRVCPSTSAEVFDQYILTLRRECEIESMKITEFIGMFLTAARNRKRLALSRDLYTFVNNILLEMLTCTKETSAKKHTIESRFNSNAAMVLEHILGKSNPGSIPLMDQVFYFLKRFVKPLENSSKAIGFLYNLLKGIFFRVEREKSTRVKLDKLLEKMKGVQRPKEQDEEEDEEEEEGPNEEQDNDGELEELQDNEMLMNDDQDAELKPDNDEERKEKMEKILVNEIDKTILEALQAHIEEMFEVVYFVNSKKAISHLLRYMYRLFPSLAIRSLDVVERAASIPNINEEGLVKNMTVGVEHMFVEATFKEGVRNVMRVLEKAYNCRRILDVWPIYEAINSKIPLLDEKDLEAVSDSDKELFEETFQMKHDRFYEEYSEHTLEAFKRFLREGEFIEKADEKKYMTTMAQIHCNSYPHMRKRLLAEVMEVITDKPNALALSFFVFSAIPKREADILFTQMKSINFENKVTEELRLNMLSVLAKTMSLEQFKPYIREMASKGYFRLVQDYALYRVVEDIEWEPWPTTLKYMQENPKISISFDIQPDNVKQGLKDLEAYRDELLEEVALESKNVEVSTEGDLSDRVIESYTNSDKIKTHQERKNIHEALTLAALINQLMETNILTIISKKIQILESGVKPYGFLEGRAPHINVVKQLLASQEILSDSKIVKTLRNLLTSEFFMYEDIIFNERKKAEKERKKNRNHEAPDYANRIIYGNEYISNSRAYMAVVSHNKCCLSLDYEHLAPELFTLLMANSTDHIKDLVNMYLRKKMGPILRNQLMEVVRKRVENRLFIKRISDVLEIMAKHEIQFSNEDILELINYHSQLVQAKDAKVRENAIKSFKKFIKILNYHPLNDQLISQINQYLQGDKTAMIWITYVIIVINHPDQKADPAKAEQRILLFLSSLEPLLLHDSRSVRRTCLYVFSSLIRKLKKIHVSFERVEEESKYERKSLRDFMETGYLHPKHYESDLKDRQQHVNHPSTEYRIKKPYLVPRETFSFLLDKPENARRFVKDFHSDMAATTEMLISSIQNSMMSVDLFSIATKALEGVVFIIKTREMNISKSESLVGGKFFKYLCLQDSTSGYKFFSQIKQFVLECLTNLESLDNQVLVLLYSHSLLNAYETNFSEPNAEVEQFLSKIIEEIITKSSGAIFRKFQAVFFQKSRNRKALKFICALCERLISEKRKVSRAEEILTTIHNKSYFKCKEIFADMLTNRIQLEKNNISNAMFNLLLYPQMNPWSLQDLEKTQIIDLEGLKSDGSLVFLRSGYVLYSNHELHRFILQELTSMMQSPEIVVQKTGFTLLVNGIRSCKQLYISESNSDFCCELLKLGFKVVNTQSELELGYDLFYKSLRELFGGKKLPEEIFEKYLLTTLQCADSKKRWAEILTEILAGPCNYLTISTSTLIVFINKVLDLEDNAALYKQCLLILSTLFSYKRENLEVISSVTDSKTKRALLLQAYCLANSDKLEAQPVKEVLRISGKERKNVWAREMMLAYGQREYFEGEESYELWRVVKSLSNPYHYHA